MSADRVNTDLDDHEDDAWVPGGEGSAVPAGITKRPGGIHHGLTSPRMMLRNSGTLVR